jgi:hypothetical protein
MSEQQLEREFANAKFMEAKRDVRRAGGEEATAKTPAEKQGLTTYSSTAYKSPANR